MAQNDVYHVTIVASWSNMQLMNDYHVRMLTTTEPTQNTFALFATDCREIFRPSQTLPVVYQRWSARQVVGNNVSWTQNPCRPTGGSLFDGTWTTGNSGGAGANAALPPQCALVTTLKSNFTGRRRRGRIYAFGWQEVHQTDGLWETSLTGTLQTAWNTFVTKYGSSGTDPNLLAGIWSFRTASGCLASPGQPMHAHDAPDPTNSFVGLASAVVRPVVYTQRRRTIGVGR